MQETRYAIENLKKLLKSKHINYADLVPVLQLSEPSIKRLFSNHQFSLERLEKVCHFAGLSMSQLFSLNPALAHEDSYTYTIEQESFFAKNPKYLAFYDLLLRYGQLKKVYKQKPNLKAQQTHLYLKKLEQLGLIKRLPKDKIQFTTSRNVRWRAEGPLRKTFLEWAKKDYLSKNFKEPEEKFKFNSIELSEISINKIKGKIDELEKDIAHYGELDKLSKTPTQNWGLLFAYKPWVFRLLEEC